MPGRMTHVNVNCALLRHAPVAVNDCMGTVTTQHA